MSCHEQQAHSLGRRAEWSSSLVGLARRQRQHLDKKPPYYMEVHEQERSRASDDSSVTLYPQQLVNVRVTDKETAML